MPEAILVVEDNKTQQRLMKILADRLGIDAHIVSNATEALAALSESSYCLVLMDWHLPGMDGLECTKHIRQMDATKGRHTPVVAVTGKGDEALKRCLNGGMDGFLAKPFTIAQFQEVIDRWTV